MEELDKIKIFNDGRRPMDYTEAIELKECIVSDFDRVVSIFEELQQAMERFDAEAGVCHLDKINEAIVAGFVPGSEWHFTRNDGVEMNLRFIGYLPYGKLRFLILDGEYKGEEQDAEVEIILRHIASFGKKGEGR